jgi:hypothetical protein
MRPYLRILGLTTLFLSFSATADTLLIERAAQAKMANVPKKGMTMAQVEAKFGEPSEKVAAVGKPPISKWIYPLYTVYFEYKHVINSVLNKADAAEVGPKPTNH